MSDLQDSTPTPRLSGESEQAYAAFLRYRDLGRDRSVVHAYRQFTGKEEATQASGTWNAWAKDHAWEERARAYDQWLQA